MLRWPWPNKNSTRPNLDRLSSRNGPINFFDLEIRDGNAAGSPIAAPVKSPDPAAAVRQSVNNNVASRRETLSSGAIDVARLGIRDVQRQMVIAVRFVEIDRV